METLTLVYVILVGLVIGSFLNVVIYRLPRGGSLVRPPSTCPGCGARIKPYDNVPVLSWLWLRGRCRACKKKISPVYPLVEALTAAAFAAVFLAGGRVPDPLFVAACVFTAGLIALGFIDFFHQILPDEITLGGTGLWLVYSLFREDLTLGRAALGGAVGAGIILLIYWTYRLLRKKEGMGLGDVTMMLYIGTFLGWQKAILTLVLASFAGALAGIALILFRKKDLQHAMPFGTFLAPAAFAALVRGDAIIRSYLALWTR